MELRDVQNSSQIAADGYDEQTQTLRIRFKNGDTWDYHIDPRTNMEYQYSESKGKYFSRVIKPNIQGVKQ